MGRKIYFDGGCRPNPGVMETAIVLAGEASIRADAGVGDNTLAEWLALLHAIETAVARGLDDIVLLGDSRVVIHQARGEWRCRDARLQACLDRYRDLAARIARVRIRPIARTQNLAGIALARQWKRPVPVAGIEPATSSLQNWRSTN